MKSVHVLMVLAIALAAAPGNAQIAPNEMEVQAYDGLLEAAYEGNAKGVRDQLAAGADASVRDAMGRTPAHIAAYTSDEAVLEQLAAAGADLDALEFQRYDIVTIAAVANDPGFLKKALDLGASAGNTTSMYDGTALIAAAHLGHFEVVQILIDAGAPLDHVNNLGWTALMEAVVLGDGGPDHIRTVKALVDAGADRSIADRQGRTPLQHATQRGYSEIVRLLQ